MPEGVEGPVDRLVTDLQGNRLEPRDVDVARVRIDDHGAGGRGVARLAICGQLSLRRARSACLDMLEPMQRTAFGIVFVCERGRRSKRADRGYGEGSNDRLFHDWVLVQLSRLAALV